MNLLESLQAQGIIVTVDKDADGDLALTLSTNGRGVPKELIDLASMNRELLGVQLVEQLIEQRNRLN